MVASASALFLGWQDLISIVLGSSIVTTFAIWSLARFTSAFDAYSGEHAKLLAQFDNVDKLVAQTEKLTEAAEAIKVKLSDQVWDRQNRWTHKRDIYVRMIEALGKVRSGFARVQAGFRGEEAGYDWAEKVAEEGRVQATSAYDEFLRAYDVAPIAVSPTARRALSSALKIKHTGFTNATEVEPTIAAFRQCIAELQEEAQKDLGFDA
jgi:hypothetical protein